MVQKKKESSYIGIDEALEVVREYLKVQYRPYSVQDLILNLHNRVNKPTMIKTLEVLVEENSIICKTYGKTSYYTYVEIPVSEEDIHDVTSEKIDKLRDAYNKQLDTAEKLQKEYTEVTSLPTNEELEERLDKLQDEISKLESDINAVKSTNSIELSTKDIYQLKKKMKKMKSTFIQRKRLLDNFIGLIKEGMDDYIKILDEIGIDQELLYDLSHVAALSAN